MDDENSLPQTLIDNYDTPFPNPYNYNLIPDQMHNDDLVNSVWRTQTCHLWRLRLLNWSKIKTNFGESLKRGDITQLQSVLITNLMKRVMDRKYKFTETDQALAWSDFNFFNEGNQQQQEDADVSSSEPMGDEYYNYFYDSILPLIGEELMPIPDGRKTRTM